jgi:glycine cleavage system H protein
MDIPKYLKFSKDHEWANWDEEDGIVTVGITDYAQNKIGDITYIELPEEDEEVEKGTSFAEIEHHKGVEEVYCPVGGRIVEVNSALVESPELINQDPYEDGWLIKVEANDPSDLEDLMSADEYAEYLAELQEDEG